MSKLKPAGARLSKSNESAGGRRDGSCEKQRPSSLALLHACMNFVGGVGRLLDLAVKAYTWWQHHS